MNISQVVMGLEVFTNSRQLRWIGQTDLKPIQSLLLRVIRSTQQFRVASASVRAAPGRRFGGWAGGADREGWRDCEDYAALACG